jgi:hypothetical protein
MQSNFHQTIASDSEAVNLICWRYENGETCVINMPPRYGKSDVIRLTSQQLNAETKLPGVMMAPWTDNADQINEKEKIDQMYERYGVSAGVPFTHEHWTNEW